MDINSRNNGKALTKRFGDTMARLSVSCYRGTERSGSGPASRRATASASTRTCSG